MALVIAALFAFALIVVGSFVLTDEHSNGFKAD
jgi:hypothetical protein